MIRKRGLLAVAALVLGPTPADAQPETFRRAAQALVESSKQSDPGRLDSVHAAADRMAAALSEWDRGISAAETSVYPRGYAQHVELGLTYRTRGRLADALREFDAAAALQPSASDVHVLRALTLEAAGQFDAAARAFLTAWTRDAANPVKAYYVATRRGIPVGDRERARALLAETYRRLPAAGVRPSTPPFLVLDAVPDNLSPSPVVADAVTAEGFAWLIAGKYADAALALRKAGQAGAASDSPSSHFARAQRAEADNHVSEARREYQTALAGTITGRSVLLVAIARLAQVDGDSAGPAVAIEALNQAARLDPNNLSVRKELAAAYAAAGQADEAFCELMAALLVDPRHAQAHASIGQLDLDAGRAADAVTAFNRALELAPDRYEIRYSLATAYTRLGKAAEADRQFEIFDRLRREALEKRRREIANEVGREERSRAR